MGLGFCGFVRVLCASESIGASTLFEGRDDVAAFEKRALFNQRASSLDAGANRRGFSGCGRSF